LYVSDSRNFEMGWACVFTPTVDTRVHADDCFIFKDGSGDLRDTEVCPRRDRVRLQHGVEVKSTADVVLGSGWIGIERCRNLDPTGRNEQELFDGIKLAAVYCGVDPLRHPELAHQAHCLGRYRVAAGLIPRKRSAVEQQYVQALLRERA